MLLLATPESGMLRVECMCFKMEARVRREKVVREATGFTARPG